jgi:hypothetical protein
MTFWCQKWLDWELLWILIVTSPHYGNATDDGTPASQNGSQPSRNESHVKKDRRQPNKSGYYPKGNKGRPRTPERRNASQNGSQYESQNRRQSREDGCLGSRIKDMEKINYGLPRSNGDQSAE